MRTRASQFADSHGAWLVAGVALLARLAIILTVPPGYPGDMAGWVDTTRQVTLYGIQQAYANLLPGNAYPPGFMYPLWLTGHVYQWCCSATFQAGNRDLDVVMLLGPVLADTALAVLVYALARRLPLAPKAALAAGLLYALSPAALTTVAWQGQVGDPYYALPVLAAVLAALSRRPILASACLVLAVLIKPQGLAFVPLVGLLLLRQGRPWRVLAGIGVAALLAALALVPFVLAGTLHSVWYALLDMGVIHAYTQNSADNLWLLLQPGPMALKLDYLDGAVPDSGIFFAGLSYMRVGLLLFLALYAAVLVRLVWAGSARAATLAAATVALGFFYLNTRMHVNYSFLAFPFLCVLAASGTRRAQFALAGATLANLVDWDALGHYPWPEGLPVHQAGAAIYGLCLLALCSLMLGRVARRQSTVARQGSPQRAVGAVLVAPTGRASGTDTAGSASCRTLRGQRRKREGTSPSPARPASYGY